VRVSDDNLQRTPWTTANDAKPTSRLNKGGIQFDDRRTCDHRPSGDRLLVLSPRKENRLAKGRSSWPTARRRQYSRAHGPAAELVRRSRDGTLRLFLSYWHDIPRFSTRCERLTPVKSVASSPGWLGKLILVERTRLLLTTPPHGRSRDRKIGVANHNPRRDEFLRKQWFGPCTFETKHTIRSADETDWLRRRLRAADCQLGRAALRLCTYHRFGHARGCCFATANTGWHKHKIDNRSN
jgi:hypothetical protein